MSVSGDSASGRPYGFRRHTSELVSLELDGEIETEPEWARILQRRMKRNEVNHKNVLFLHACAFLFTIPIHLIMLMF